MYKETLLSTTLGFLIMQFLLPCIQGQSQTHNYKTIMIFTGPIRLTVGHNYWTKFHIPQNVTSSYLKGYIRASGSIINTVTLKLYEADNCPSPDLKGSIDFNKCRPPMLSGDYLQAEQILKYISHAGNFYLVFENNSPLFDKTISGNLRIEYLG
ncbi:MAG TPA: hypothetical protein VI278_13150 [Nitrososphaeraceae archaeon]